MREHSDPFICANVGTLTLLKGLYYNILRGHWYSSVLLVQRGAASKGRMQQRCGAVGNTQRRVTWRGGDGTATPRPETVVSVRMNGGGLVECGGGGKQ